MCMHAKAISLAPQPLNPHPSPCAHTKVRYP
jgi:hypothetical protein